MHLSDRYVEALAYAVHLHRDQVRKGSGVPYVTHLLSASSLVGEFGGDEDQMIAALLHDAAEDQGGAPTLEAIRTRFGDVVADYVDGCTDTFDAPKPPWRPRKVAFIKRIASATPELRLVVAADKLHNVRSMLTDYREVGESLWDRFTMGRDDTLWYHAEIVSSLGAGWDHPILRELSDAVSVLHTRATSAGET